MSAVSTELAHLLAAWKLWGLASGHSERTIVERRGAVVRLAATGVDPIRATRTDLEVWLADLATTVQRSTLATRRAQIRSWFSWLHDAGHIEVDPSVKLPNPKAPRGIPHPLTVGEVAQVLQACADPRARTTRAYVILAAYAGLRVHEIAKLRGEDVRGGEIRVTGKGGVSATVPMHPMIGELAATMPTTGWWFPTTAPSGHVHRCSVSDAIARAMKRAGVVGVPHGLRHHFCTEVLRATGGDLRTTQRAARHASPATTAIYTQVSNDTLAAAVGGIPTAS